MVTGVRGVGGMDRQRCIQIQEGKENVDLIKRDHEFKIKASQDKILRIGHLKLQINESSFQSQINFSDKDFGC